jgi:hypothetical protein
MAGDTSVDMLGKRLVVKGNYFSIRFGNGSREKQVCESDAWVVPVFKTCEVAVGSSATRQDRVKNTTLTIITTL